MPADISDAHVRLDSAETAHTDYRESHLLKGDRYDTLLAADPLDAYMAHREQDILRQTIPNWFPDGVGRYLDFACGTGRISEIVVPFAREAVGVDISETMLAQARRRCPSMLFVNADLTIERPALGQFDLITAFRFFGNAQNDLRTAALAAMHRLLKDDGYLVFNNHRNPLSTLALAGRVTGVAPGTDLTHAKLTRMLKAAGFRIVSGRGIGAWIFRHRLLQPAVLRSRTARVLERVFGARVFVPLSLDAVFVATKQRARSK
jgi:ubiquinone/menaquinone biosynthesis C-methylase UbiE